MSQSSARSWMREWPAATASPHAPKSEQSPLVTLGRVFNRKGKEVEDEERMGVRLHREKRRPVRTRVRAHDKGMAHASTQYHTSHHITSYHITLRHVASHRITSYADAHAQYQSPSVRSPKRWMLRSFL